MTAAGDASGVGRGDSSDRAPRLAFALAAVGGAVDAAGFIVLLGLFTAHLSGNTTGLGVALGTGDWRVVVQRGFVIPVFVLATAAGVALVDGLRRRHPAVPGRGVGVVLLAEAGLLAAFTVTAAQFGYRADFAIDTPPYFLVGALAATAMGLQNAALRRVAGLAVHTTFVTGMLTEAAVGAVGWWQQRRDDGAEATRARHQAVLAAGVWAAYLAGGTLSALAVSHERVGVLVVPIAVLVVLGVRLGWRASGPVTSAGSS